MQRTFQLLWIFAFARVQTTPVSKVNANFELSEMALEDLDTVESAGSRATSDDDEQSEDYDVTGCLVTSEYAQDIMKYLRSSEVSRPMGLVEVEFTSSLQVQALPDPNYMRNQLRIDWAMRAALVDWLIDVHYEYEWQPESLFLAINILDRFLGLQLADRDNLQLFGGAALLIAIKAEDIYAGTFFALDPIVAASDRAFTADELRKAEIYLLETIGWNVNFSNPFSFLRYIFTADPANGSVRRLAKFFCDIGVVDYKLVSVPPSLLSAAAIWLARRVDSSTEMVWVSLTHVSISSCF